VGGAGEVQSGWGAEHGLGQRTASLHLSRRIGRNVQQVAPAAVMRLRAGGQDRRISTRDNTTIESNYASGEGAV
jgi:hypothetical protein